MFYLLILKKILYKSEKHESYRLGMYRMSELEEKVNIHKDKGCQISQAMSELKAFGIGINY